VDIDLYRDKVIVGDTRYNYLPHPYSPEGQDALACGQETISVT